MTSGRGLARGPHPLIILLRRRRHLLNLNQASVGRLMGSMVESPQRMVSDIECGACEEPSFRLVERYAAALGLAFKLVHLDGTDLEGQEL